MKNTRDPKRKVFLGTLVTEWAKVPKPEGFIIPDYKWRLLCHNAFYCWHTLLLGPSGVGKTSITKYVAECLNKNFVYFNCGEFSDAIGALKGNVHLRQKDGTVETVFVRSKLVEAIGTPNNLILLDEINRAPYEVTNQLFSIIDDSTRVIQLDEEVPPTEVRLGEGTVFFATANVGSRFTGVRPIDAAFLDRFLLITLEHLAPKEEANLIKSRAHIPSNTAWKIAKFAAEARKLFEQGELPAAWSHRQSIRVGQLVKHGFSLEEAILAIAEGLYYTESLEERGEYATKVKQILQKL